MKKVAAFVGSMLFVGFSFAGNIVDDVNFSAKVNFDTGADIRIRNIPMTSSAADLNLAGNTVKATVNTEVAVTNNQTVSVVAGQINQLKSTGTTTLGTNTILLAVAPAADVGKITIIQNGTTASNALAIAAATGFYYGPAISLLSNECTVVIATATNKYVSLGNQ